MAIIFIMAAAVTLNSNAFKQTAKDQAERVAAFIHKQARKADRHHLRFAIRFPEINQAVKEFNILWEYNKNDSNPNIVKINNRSYLASDEAFKLSCPITASENDIVYEPVGNGFRNLADDTLKLVITDSNNETYSVLLYKNGGMTRAVSE